MADKTLQLFLSKYKSSDIQLDKCQRIMILLLPLTFTYVPGVRALRTIVVDERTQGVECQLGKHGRYAVVTHFHCCTNPVVTIQHL